MLKALRSYRPSVNQTLTRLRTTTLFETQPLKAFASTPTIRGVSSGRQHDDPLFLKSNDPVFQRLKGAYDDYRLDQRDFGDISKTMHGPTAANRIQPADPAYGFTGGPDAEAGDPLGCDSAEMRVAKARSQNAWVSAHGALLTCQGLTYPYPDYMRGGVREVRASSAGQSIFLHRTGP
jgi:hypothetical protein